MKLGTLAGILNRTTVCLPIVLLCSVIWLFSFSLYSQITHPNSTFQVNETTPESNASVNISLPVLSHEGQILSGHSVTGNPLKGTLNTTVGNSYVYTPTYYQTGNDSFDWQALDTSTGITLTYRCIIQINSLNSPPTDLNSTATLAIAENQPIGTVVGEFNATDPDSNATLTYHLVSGAGDTHNSLFTLEANGTLRTATTFDYETNASNYSIRIQVRDEFNATMEGNFSVSLTDDAFEDTDGDGFRDSLEVSTGSDLNDPNSTPLQQGLVAWYPFDGNSSDMSGNGLDGVVYGASLGKDRHDREGRSYLFDGNDYIKILQNPILDISNNVTISVWFKGNQLANEAGIIIYGKEGSWGRTSYGVWSSSYSVVSSYSTSSSSGFMVGSNSLNNGVWYNMSFIFSDGVGKTYLNGMINQTKTASHNTLYLDNGRDLRIGVDHPGGPEFFNGSIDDIRIYNRALSAEEIRLLYEVEVELPTGSVTSAKLSPALSDLIDGNGSLEQALPAGSVIAGKPGETPPPGYTLFQRNEYNASSLVWEEKAPVSVARSAFDGVGTINGKIYFAGGWNGTSNSDFELYDPTLNSWSSLTPLSVPRSGIATAVLNDKLFLIGGEGYSFVDVYDPVTEQWSSAQALPSVVTKGTAITVGGKIYLIGGQNQSGDKLNQVLEYNPDLNSWSQKANMQYARHGLKAVYFDGRIWAIGGRNLSTLNVVESFDLQSNSWRVETSLSTTRDWSAVWSTEEGIFTAGGDNSGTNQSSIELYDRLSEQWSLIGHLPEAGRNMGTAVLGDKIFLVGGTDASFNYSNKVYSADLPTPAMNLYFKDGNATAEAELSTLGMTDGSVMLGQLAPDALTKIGLDHNPATAEGSLLAVPRGSEPPPGYALYKRSYRNGSLVWEEKAPVSAARSVYDGAVGLNNKIYLMGGSSGETKATYVYLPSSDSWIRLSDMNSAHTAGAYAETGGKIFAIGGSQNPTSLEIYDPVLDQWIAGPAVPQPVKYCSAISLNGVIYVVGCRISDTNSDRIFAYDSLSQTWSEKSNMPTARHAASLVVLDGKIWAMGGWTGQPSNVPTNKVEIYDPITNTWSNGPSLDIAKAWTSAWLIDGEIHVAGGNDNQGGNYRSEVLRLDNGTNQWVQVSTLPEPKAYAGYAQIEGMVFQISGSTSNGVHSDKVFAADITPPMDLYYREANASGNITLDKLSMELADEFAGSSAVSAPVGLVTAVNYNDENPGDHTILERTDRNATHQWEEMAPVSVARYAYDGVEEMDGKLYFVGGRSGTTNFNIFERYNPSINQWESLANMPNSRGGVCSAFLDGKLYAIGGEGRSTVDVYDPLNNSWSSGPSLPYVVDGAAAITHQNKLYVIGGGSMATVRDSVFELNSTSNTWIQKASMPTARVGLRLLEHEGKIWAIGGYHATNGAQSIVEIYDPSSDSWVSGTSLNTERNYPVVWKQHENLFVGGGQAKDNSFLSSVEYFDIQNGQWKDAGNLPEPKRAASAKVVDGKIYIVAGSTANGVYSNKLHAADFLPNRDLYFRSAASQSNRGPANLNVIGSLNFAENQPAGTVVGDFNATDSDANATLTYHLVSGVGDTHNSLFTLETNGTLKTASVFDYESNASTYTIRVQAKDEFNAATEGSFTVALSNANDPVTGNITILGTPVVGQTLTASNNLSDPDGLGVLSYQWYRDGQPILYGGTLKDEVNGVDGLDYARTVTLSADGGHAYVAAAEDNSVSWFDRDISTGALTYRGMLKDGLGGVDGLNKAYVVTLSSDHKNAFVTSNFQNSLSWFDRNETTGALIYGGTLKDGVGGVDGLRKAINSSLSSDGKHIYVVGREDNSVSWFDRDLSTGALTYGGMLKDDLGGVDGLWQAHWVTLSANGLHAYVVAERDYSLSWFDRNQTTGALTYRGTLWDGLNGVDGLFSPRSVKFSPCEKHLYVAAAGDNSVSWFERNASTGALSFGGMLKDGLNGVDGLDGAFQLTASPDGRFMYVVAVFDNSVSWYERNASTGALSFGGMLKDGLNGVDGLDGAESITTSPDGSHVYIAACNDDSVSWFTRDPVTGALTYGSASDANYTLTPADAGSVITVTASYTDGGGFEHNISSAGTPLVYPAYQPSQPNHFVDLNSSVNLEMIWVEPGTFTMGSPVTEVGREDDENQTLVTLTKGFYLGKYEVTQAQYEAVMTGDSSGLSATPSQFGGNPNRPVEKVSWEDAQVFLTRLNEAEQMAGRLPVGWSYVLPTESQWEYACRAGKNTEYSLGNVITSSNVNYNRIIGQTTNVGTYAPNYWGFYDMHGNVLEWTADWYQVAYPVGNPVIDPIGPSSGSYRVLRGGSWASEGTLLRSAKRFRNWRIHSANDLGFRLSFQHNNNSLTDLNSSAPLIIAENKPVGTVVGEFNATDSNNSTVIFSLVQGGGTSLNQYFALDSAGVLRTTAVLDFEQTSNLTIRVRASGSNGDSFERDFQVQVQDVVENMWTVPHAGDWLGINIDKNSSNWIYNDTLGWAYKGVADMNSTWMNLPDLGWVWTSSAVYPRFFSKNLSDWIHLVTPHPYNLFDPDFNASRIEMHPPRFYYANGSSWLSFRGASGVFDNIGQWGQSFHFAGSVGKNQSWFWAHRQIAQDLQDDWRPLEDLWPSTTPNPLSDLNVSMNTLPPLSINIPPHPSSLRLTSVTAKVSSVESASVGIAIEGSHSLFAVRGLVPYVNQNFGPVQTKITDPVLELYDIQNSLIASNDDWQSESNLTYLTESGFAPTRQKESAFIHNFAPLAYTAKLKGKSANLELGLIEFNSLEKKPDSSMHGISIRAIDPKAQFVVEGTTPRKILLVSKGAYSLTDFGIVNAVENPNISISGGWLKDGFNGTNFSSVSVDNWEDHYRAGEVNASGYAPPVGSNESAVLLHLHPGTYLVSVDDANASGQETNKVSTLEIYDLGDGRNPVKYPPQNFKLSNNSIARDKPVSSVVGELSAIDPEQPYEQVNFQLVSGIGDTHNDLFEVIYTDYGFDPLSMVHRKVWELKTRVILDDNLSDSLSVRIRASDDTNTSVEEIFLVQLLKNNMFTNSEQLGGKIVDSSYYGSLKWGNGWLKNPWFGTFYEDSSGWIFHQYLGWLYPANPENNSSHIYLPNVGWTWIDSTVYPYLYSFENSKWLRLQTMNGQSSRIYDPVANNWISYEGAKGPPKSSSLSRGELIGPVGMNGEFGISLRNFAAMTTGFIDNQAFVQNWAEWVNQNRPTLPVDSVPNSTPSSIVLTSAPFSDSNFSKIPSRIRSVRAEADLALSPLVFGFELEGNHTTVLQGIIPYQEIYGEENVRDPALELFKIGEANQSIAQNEDWANGSSSSLTESLGFKPARAKDASILQSLDDGKYEVKLKGKPDGLGLGMLEYHAVDHLGLGQINRFYVRGKTKNVSTVTFFLEGMEARKILVVAHGADALAKRGIEGGLPNPTLEMNGPNYIYVDDWEDHYRFEEVKDSGFAPPIGSLDPAVMLDLKPGLHSISVRNYLANKEGLFEISFYDLGKGDENGGPPPPENLPSIFDDLSYFKYSDTVAYLEDNGSLRLDFTVEGKTSAILAAGYGAGSSKNKSISKHLTDPGLKLFDREGKIIGQSDDWQSEDKVNELQSGMAYFGPSQGIKDPALFIEQLRPDSYGVSLEAKTNDQGWGALTMTPPDSSKMRIKDLNVTGYVSADQPLSQFIPIEGSAIIRLLIQVKGHYSGISDGLKDPKVRIKVGGENSFVVDNWLDHTNAFDLARYASAPPMDSDEPAVLLDVIPNVLWGSSLEIDVFGAVPGSEGRVQLSVYNLGRGTGSLGEKNKDVQYLWNRDLFYQTGEQVSHAGMLFQAIQLVPPGTDILSSIHWFNIPVEPVIYTEDLLPVAEGSTILRGRVVHSGNLNGLAKKGFLVSRSPILVAGDEGVIQILSESVDSSGIFEAKVNGLEPGKKYFYKAFGQTRGDDPTGGSTIVKESYGSVLSFRTPQANNSPDWANAQPGAATNWWTSSWFGSFYMNEANASWIMHSELGWLYPMASGKSGVWLWKENLGWLWADEEFYPFLYQNTSASWLYFYGSSQDRLLFYHYREERWLEKIRQKMN